MKIEMKWVMMADPKKGPEWPGLLVNGVYVGGIIDLGSDSSTRYMALYSKEFEGFFTVEPSDDIRYLEEYLETAVKAAILERYSVLARLGVIEGNS